MIRFGVHYRRGIWAKANMGDDQRRGGGNQDKWAYVGMAILVSLGMVILSLAGFLWQTSDIVSDTTRVILVVTFLMNLLIWLLVAIYYHLAIGWQKRLEDTLQRLERPHAIDVESLFSQLEERLGNVIRSQSEDLVHDLQQRMRESTSPITVDIGWAEALYHAFLLINEADRGERIYENVVTAFSVLTSSREVMLLLGENELGPLKLTAAVGLSSEVLHEWLGREWRPPLWGVVAPTLAKRRPYSSPVQISEQGRHKHEFPWETKGERLLALPLMGAQNIQGVVVLTYDAERRLDTQPFLRILEVIAQFAGRTIENINLARTTQEHVAELVTLYSITRSLASATSMDELLALLGAEVEQVIGGAYVGFVLGDGRKDAAVYAPFPPSSPEFSFLVDRIDWRVVRWVYDAVQPVFYTPNAVGEDVGSVMFETSGPVMVIPIEGRDAVLGVLIVVSSDERRVFEEHHLVGMRTISSALAVGLAAIRSSPSFVETHPKQLTGELQ